jgi:hypothetical protein
MTNQGDFTSSEWEQVLEAPPSAAMLVITAQRGGLWRETIAMGKAYAEARAQHGESELLDEIVSAKPKLDHTRYHSPEELREHALAHVRDGVAVLEGKAAPQEREEYQRFIVNLAEKVARAHTEGKHGGDAVSQAEQDAIDSIKGALDAGT